MSILTEAEAKMRWCPFAMARSDGGSPGYPAVNRTWTREDGPTAPQACRCVATACMAWRSVTAPDDFSARIAAIKQYRADHGTGLAESKHYVEAHLAEFGLSPELRGYCGLVGRP